MPGIIGIKSKDFAQLNSCNQTFISSVSIPNKACPYHDNEWENPPYVFFEGSDGTLYAGFWFGGGIWQPIGKLRVFIIS